MTTDCHEAKNECDEQRQCNDETKIGQLNVLLVKCE